MIVFSLIIDNMINQDNNFIYSSYRCEEELLMHKLEEFMHSSIVLGVKYQIDEQEVSYWFGEEIPISHFANMNPERITSKEADSYIGQAYEDFIVLKNQHLILVDDKNRHIKELVKSLLNDNVSTIKRHV